MSILSAGKNPLTNVCSVINQVKTKRITVSNNLFGQEAHLRQEGTQ